MASPTMAQTSGVAFTRSHLSGDVFGPGYTDPIDPVTNKRIKHPVVLCSRAEELAVLMQITICKTIYRKGVQDWVRENGSVNGRTFVELFKQKAPQFLAGRWDNYPTAVQDVAARIFLSDDGYINLDPFRIYDRSTLEDKEVLESLQKDEDVSYMEHPALRCKISRIAVKENQAVSFGESIWSSLSQKQKGEVVTKEEIRNTPFYHIMKFLMAAYMSVFRIILKVINR